MKIEGVLLKRGEVFPNGDVIAVDCDITIGKSVVGGPVFNDFDHKQIAGEVLSINIKDGAVIAQAEIDDAYNIGKELSIGYTTPSVRFDDNNRIVEKIIIKTTSLIHKSKDDE